MQSIFFPAFVYFFINAELYILFLFTIISFVIIKRGCQVGGMFSKWMSHYLYIYVNYNNLYIYVQK